MRLEIVFASAVMAAGMGAGAHAQTTSCRHDIFDRVRCRPAPAQPAVTPAEPAPPPQAAPPPVQAAPAAQATEHAPFPSAAPVPAIRAQQAAPAPRPAAPARQAAVPPPPAAPVETAIDPRTVPTYACNFAQSMTLGPAVCQARNVAQARRHVSELIAAHHCDRAAQAALQTGDAAFAGRVRALCRPASP